MRKSLLALLLVAVGGLAQAAVQLKDNHPERYTVVKGDTLWDIPAASSASRGNGRSCGMPTRRLPTLI